jgi:hypothetical protein
VGDVNWDGLDDIVVFSGDAAGVVLRNSLASPGVFTSTPASLSGGAGVVAELDQGASSWRGRGVAVVLLALVLRRWILCSVRATGVHAATTVRPPTLTCAMRIACRWLC